MASKATLDRLLAEFDHPPEQLTAALALLEEGATPVFVSRFRRHLVGNLPEERLHAVAERLHALLEVEQRKSTILQQAEERGRRTPALEATLEASVDQDLLDDIYQSMRPRRRGLAMQMEEKGLMPLVMALQHRQMGEQPLHEVAAQYVAADQGLPTPEAVLEGAVIIIADRIAHDPETRARFRDELRRGILRARAVNPDDGNAARYKDFFEFAEPIGRIPANRMLALRRAEREGILTLELTLPEGRSQELLGELHGHGLVAGTQLFEFFSIVFAQATLALQDICGKDVRRRLKEKADRESVRTYARNLRSQLLSPPLGAKKVLSLRTSSKVVWAVLLGEDGSVQQHKTLPVDNDEQKQGASTFLCELIRSEKPAAIAVPHGRRQAGSERVTAELRRALGETPLPMVVAIDEAASTIFATSAAGKKAIPGVEVGTRTAISLGRRLQDPLSELARMELRTLGLGQTLDDVHQGMLQRELGAVTSSCLALVGCDLNTTNQDILEQLPGLDAERAKAILDHRRKIGGFANRSALAEVPGIDAVTVRNIAAFLCIHGGTEPLDTSAVHPEDYALVNSVAAKKGVAATDLLGHGHRDFPVDDVVTESTTRAHAICVLQQLQWAKDDPRGELVATANEGVNSLADLHADRELRGRIANLTEFGAFVDLGIGQDGLVHISQIPNQRLRDSQQMLCVGEVVTVWVINVDPQKQKISLTMLKPRHLAEGRLQTVGERLDQQQGRRRPRGQGEPGSQGGPGSPRGRPEAAPARAPGRTFGSGGRRPPGGPGEDAGDHRRAGGRGGPRRDGDRDRERFGDSRPRDRGPREQRVYTVEPALEVADTRTHKGEVTSLSNLRALLGGLGGKRPAADSKEAAPPSAVPPPTPPPAAEPGGPATTTSS